MIGKIYKRINIQKNKYIESQNDIIVNWLLYMQQ
jgi:hypothetical protein